MRAACSYAHRGCFENVEKELVKRAVDEVKSSGFVIDAAWGWEGDVKYVFMIPVYLIEWRRGGWHWLRCEILQEDVDALQPPETYLQLNKVGCAN